MNLEKILNPLKDRLNRRKPHFDRATDPIYFTVASNAGLILGAHSLLDSYGDEPIAIAGISAAASASVLLLNRYFISSAARRIRLYHQRKIRRNRQTTKWGWYRTFMQYFLPLSILGISSYADDIRDIKRRAESYFTEKYKPNLPEIPVPNPAILEEKKNKILRARLREIVEEEIKNSRRETDDGRFYRTFRWEEIFRYVGRRYGIKDDLLAGIAMHESYGDPLTIGPTNDLGLMQIIPSTGRRLCGMKVHSDPTSDKMRELVRKHNGNLELLSGIDDRFNPAKSAECAARHLKKDYDRYINWDKAVSAYNRGVPARNLREHHYVANVKRSRDFYRRKKEELLARASSGSQKGREAVSEN